MSLSRENKICIKCKACCNYLSFNMTANNWENFKETVRFYEARGEQVKSNPITLSIGVLIKKKCQHITTQGCKIYDQRPLSCRVYDGRNDPLMNQKCKLPKGK